MTERAERLTQSELARRLGLTPNAIRKHVERGLYPKGADDKFAWPDCKFAYEATVDPVRRYINGKAGGDAVTKRSAFPKGATLEGDKGPDDPGHERIMIAESSVSRARSANMELKNQQIEIEIAKQRGELIAKQDVLKACRIVVTTVCERLDGLPGRMAPRVVGLSSTEIEAVAREMVAEVRREIAALGAKYAEEADG